MNTLFKASLLGSAFAILAIAPSFAADQTGGKKTKEITSIVGYNVTESVSADAASQATFAKMDKNGDGAVTLKEFKNYSIYDNEYEMFSEIDTDKNKTISLTELSLFKPTKGNTEFEAAENGKKSVHGTNLKSRVYEEKTYFVPVEKTIVKEEAIAPAAGY